MPGSHDSGSYGITTTSEYCPDLPPILKESKLGNLNSLKGVIKKWSVTTDLNILQQLQNGARYLDLRVCTNLKEPGLFLCHGLCSVKLEVVLNHVKEFINTRKKEIIILDFCHFYEVNHEYHFGIVHQLIDIFGSSIAHVSSPKQKVRHFWKKGEQLVILYEDRHATHPWQWRQEHMYSFWGNSQELKDLKPKMFEALDKRFNDKFHVFQGLLTPTLDMIVLSILPFKLESLKALVTKSNDTILNWVREWKDKDFNIVMLDFFETTNVFEVCMKLNLEKYKRRKEKKKLLNIMNGTKYKEHTFLE